MKHSLSDRIIWIKKEKYICGYIEIDGLYVPQSSKIYTKEEIVNNAEIFNTKEDALYARFIESMQNDSKLSNFKGSKHFNMYMERLQKEHPEFLV